MKPRMIIAFCILIASSMLISSAVFGHGWDYCNDTPRKWEDDVTTLRIMRCSIPEDSQRMADVIYSINQWNKVKGMWDVFEREFGTTDCVDVEIGNGRNQMFFSTSSELDGAVGVTFVRSDGCPFFWSEEHIIEADIAFDASQMLERGSPPCNSYVRFGSRTTMIHELGHALGLNHYDDAMNLMMTNDGEGKYCGNFVIEPHPDDASGGRFLYSSGKSSTDIGASEHNLEDDNDVELNTASGTENLCPGDRYTFKWSVGNMGTEDVDYNVGWYLSTNSTISTSDILVAFNTGAFEPAGGFDTFTRTITIPTSVSFNTEYFLGTFVDDDDQVSERLSTNNKTYMARKIRIRSRAACSP